METQRPQVIPESPGTTLTLENGYPFTLGKQLTRGEGGEGIVFHIDPIPVQHPWETRDPNLPLVIKMYKQGSRTREKADKIRYLEHHPVEDPTLEQYNHPSNTAPIYGVINSDGTAKGAIMVEANMKEMTLLRHVANPAYRAEHVSSAFNWLFLLSTAGHLAQAADTLIENDIYQMDFNDEGVAVVTKSPGRKNTLVTIFDIDGAQVPDGKGGYFRSDLVRPRFAAPELIPHLEKGTLGQVNPKPMYVNYALGVHIFRLLMQGESPVGGNQRNEQELYKSIKEGYSVYFPVDASHRVQGRNSLPLSILPREIRELMNQCFVEGFRDPKKRPMAETWYNAIQQAMNNLEQCKSKPNHVYTAELGHNCPWCAIMREPKMFYSQTQKRMVPDPQGRGKDDPFPLIT